MADLAQKVGLVVLIAAAMIVTGVVYGRRLRCHHAWDYREDHAGDLRRCTACGDVERFEPDAGGWTAGHWNPVEPSVWKDR